MAFAQAYRPYNFRDCDGRISHILGKVESQSVNDVIAELAIEAEWEVLTDVREKVFGLCKEIYEHHLREKGIIGENDKVDIVLFRRHNKDDNETVAKDIVDLYQYAVGLKISFPKEVLTRQSKFIDVEQAEDSSEVQEGGSNISNGPKTRYIRSFST